MNSLRVQSPGPRAGLLRPTQPPRSHELVDRAVLWVFAADPVEVIYPFDQLAPIDAFPRGIAEQGCRPSSAPVDRLPIIVSDLAQEVVRARAVHDAVLDIGLGAACGDVDLQVACGCAVPCGALVHDGVDLVNETGAKLLLSCEVLPLGRPQHVPVVKVLLFYLMCHKVHHIREILCGEHPAQTFSVASVLGAKDRDEERRGERWLQLMEHLPREVLPRSRAGRPRAARDLEEW